MSLVVYASTLYGMVYGFTPVTRRNRDEFVAFVCITTPLHAIGSYGRSDKYHPTSPRHRLINALISAPIISGIALYKGYLIGKAISNATGTGHDL